MSRPVIDTSFMGGANNTKNFLTGRLRDPGELSVDILLDQDEDLYAVLIAAAETVTITVPTPSGGSGGATIAGSAACTNIDMGFPLEDAMTATLTLKYVGPITFTVSS